MTAALNSPQNAPRIMIVEDEALVALMVEDLLTDFGCQISGSFGAVDDALAYLKDAATPPPALDGAVLDVNIGGTMVFPVAEGITVLNKPINPDLLKDAVEAFGKAA